MSSKGKSGKIIIICFTVLVLCFLVLLYILSISNENDKKEVNASSADSIPVSSTYADKKSENTEYERPTKDLFISDTRPYIRKAEVTETKAKPENHHFESKIQNQENDDKKIQTEKQELQNNGYIENIDEKNINWGEKEKTDNVRLSYTKVSVNKNTLFQLVLIGAENDVSFYTDKVKINVYQQQGNSCTFSADMSGSTIIYAKYRGKSYQCKVNIK